MCMFPYHYRLTVFFPDLLLSSASFLYFSQLSISPTLCSYCLSCFRLHQTSLIFSLPLSYSLFLFFFLSFLSRMLEYWLFTILNQLNFFFVRSHHFFQVINFRFSKAAREDTVDPETYIIDPGTYASDQIVLTRFVSLFTVNV